METLAIFFLVADPVDFVDDASEHVASEEAVCVLNEEVSLSNADFSDCDMVV